MSSDFYSGYRSIAVNGIDLTHVTDLSITRAGYEKETFNVVNDNNDHDVHLEKRGEGSLTFKGIGGAADDPVSHIDGDQNDPHTLYDLIMNTIGYAEWDITNDVFSYAEAVYNSPPSTDQAYIQRILETRVTSWGGNGLGINDDPDEEGMAFPIIAGGEDIYTIKLHLASSSGDKIHTFDLEIWDDSSDEPNAKLTNSSTITIHNTDAGEAGSDDATNDYIAFPVDSDDWVTIDMSDNTPNIMGTASLTIGTKYWIVIRNTTTAGEELSVSEQVPAIYSDQSGVLALDMSAPSWTTRYPVLNIVQFQTADGMKVEVYDYKDATKATGTKYTFTKVKFMDDSGMSIAPMKAVEGRVHWFAQGADVTQIT